MRPYLKCKWQLARKSMATGATLGLLVAATVALSGCLPKKTNVEDSDVQRFGGGYGGGFHLEVIGHLKDQGGKKLKQLATDPKAQAAIASSFCKRLPEAQQARCKAGLVGFGQVAHGVTSALTVEVAEAQQSISEVIEDPQALVVGAIQIGESAVTDPNYLKDQAMSLRDDAVECAESMKKAIQTGDYKTVAEGITHAALLLIPVGKVAKAARAAEEVNLAAHAAQFGGQLKVATETVKGTGCRSEKNSDGSLSTILTVETPLIKPDETPLINPSSTEVF